MWIKLIDGNLGSKLSNKIYSVLYTMHASGEYSSPWVQYIEETLNHCGVGFVFQEQSTHGDKWLQELVKQNIRDQYEQTWNSEVNNSSKCISYRLYKTCFQMEKYFNILPYPKYIQLCKFRTSNHKLPIEVGRYRAIPRAERYCTNCNLRTLGDEFHCLFICPALHDIRNRYIHDIYKARPNVIKFGNLFSCENQLTLLNLTKFIYAASLR